MPAARSWPLAALLDLPTTWIVIWIGLLTTTVAIVWLLRTRLSHIKPWQKCAVLSLWVHVLLACLTAAVRIAVGSADGGPGYGPPIQVALLGEEIGAIATSDDLTPTPIDEAALDQALITEEAEAESPQTESDDAEAAAESAAPLEAPKLIAPPLPEAPTPAAPADEQPAADTFVADDGAAELPAVPAPPAPPREAEVDDTAKPLSAAPLAAAAPMPRSRR